MKLLITEFKKVTLYGDGECVGDNTVHYPFRGRAIRVRILGMFWLTYKYYTIEPKRWGK